MFEEELYNCGLGGIAAVGGQAQKLGSPPLRMALVGFTVFVLKWGWGSFFVVIMIISNAAKADFYCYCALMCVVYWDFCFECRGKPRSRPQRVPATRIELGIFSATRTLLGIFWKMTE